MRRVMTPTLCLIILGLWWGMPAAVAKDEGPPPPSSRNFRDLWQRYEKPRSIYDVEAFVRTFITGHYGWPREEFLQAFQKLQCNEALRQEGYVWDTNQLTDASMNRLIADANVARTRNSGEQSAEGAYDSRFNFLINAFCAAPLLLEKFLSGGQNWSPQHPAIIRGLIQNLVIVIVRISRGEPLPGSGIHDPRVQDALRTFRWGIGSCY